MNLKDVSTIVNLAIASLRIESIKTPHRKLKRTAMHIIIYGQIGSTKSSILYKVASKINGQVIKGLTKANLYGTIDRETKELIPPTIWDCRNNFLFIDEYYLNSKDRTGRELLNELLSAMENPDYTKKVSYTCKKFSKKDGELYCKLKNKSLHVKTKFGIFLNTMMQLSDRNIPEFTALKSRCICIPLKLSREQLRDIAHGKRLYTYKEFEVKRSECTITKEEYEQIEKFVYDSDIPDTSYLRKIEDLCRVLAILGHINKEVFDIILQLP